MNILGISALYHDSAAAIVVDGNIAAAAQEERFSRIKHDKALPGKALNYCLAQTGLTAEDIDVVCYYDHPFLTLERWLVNAAEEKADAENIIKRSFDGMFSQKLRVKNGIMALLPGFHGKFMVCRHHISHAASAFYPSPFENAAVLTLDGVGEWGTTAIAVGHGARLDIVRQIDYPNSLGLLYSALTYFCGFKVNSGEYKLMGLAPYGKPVYKKQIFDNLVDVKNDGSFALNTDFFEFTRGNCMTGEAFEQLFGVSRRQPEAQIRQVDLDLAASVQEVTEEIVLKLARTARKITGLPDLCLAGGVALNCKANGRLLREKIFDHLWIQPASGDAGGALGAALATWYMNGNSRKPCMQDSMHGSYLGPEITENEVRALICRYSASAHRFDDIELAEKVADILNNGAAVGVAKGRMEFGPRALGNRSIIASPLDRDMQSRLNLKIKFRESFRPFAPAVNEEKTQDYFDLEAQSPYMLLIAPVKKELRMDFDLAGSIEAADGNLLPVVNIPRSQIPAVTHVDFSARVQSVSANTNPFFHSVIEKFGEKSGFQVVVNTSFNVRGEPIVATAEDAYRCFMRTGLDAVVIGNYIFLKTEQPQFEDCDNWRDKYELD